MKWFYFVLAFCFACVTVAPPGDFFSPWLTIPLKAMWLLGTIGFCMDLREEARRG